MNEPAKLNIRITAAFIIVGLSIWMLTSAPPERPRSGNAEEGFADLIVSFKRDIEALRRSNEEVREKLQLTRRELADLNERLPGILTTLTERVEALENRPAPAQETGGK